MSKLTYRQGDSVKRLARRSFNLLIYICNSFISINLQNAKWVNRRKWGKIKEECEDVLVSCSSTKKWAIFKTVDGLPRKHTAEVRHTTLSSLQNQKTFSSAISREQCYGDTPIYWAEKSGVMWGLQSKCRSSKVVTRPSDSTLHENVTQVLETWQQVLWTDEKIFQMFGWGRNSLSKGLRVKGLFQCRKEQGTGVMQQRRDCRAGWQHHPRQPLFTLPPVRKCVCAELKHGCNPGV